MSKYALRWVIGLMSFSLLGLTAFQVYWISNVLTANEQRFNRDIIEAINNVALKLEKQEALHVVSDNLDTRFKLRTATTLKKDSIELVESTFQKRVISVSNISEDSLENLVFFDFTYDFETNQIHEAFNLEDSTINRDTRLMDNDMDKEIKPAAKHLDSVKMELAVLRGELRKVAKKSEMVNVVIHELLTGQRNIESRIDQNQLDSLIRSELTNEGIDIPYGYGIYNQIKDSLIYVSDEQLALAIHSSELKGSLFPNDILNDSNYLHIHFPDQRNFLLGKVWLTLGSSAILLIIIVLCFAYAILIIIRQKKISEIKNDFINNMTHEFKTPISTVALACEVLQDEQIKATKSLTDRYLKIITDENKRLGLQVEKVLQMAALERKDFKLKIDEVNVHQIIEKALENINLQVEKRGGLVTKNLQAEYQLVNADEMHLTNIIYNLLDNANKYSTEKPEIIISTQSSAKGIFINIIDKGIGMSRDAAAKIFERFYRVPTENLHDVKGFGLGLAYVKSMVEAHGGSITVKSEPKKGSNFEIYLPFEYGKI